jgi:hypothetical protein
VRRGPTDGVEAEQQLVERDLATVQLEQELRSHAVVSLRVLEQCDVRDAAADIHEAGILDNGGCTVEREARCVQHIDLRIDSEPGIVRTHAQHRVLRSRTVERDTRSDHSTCVERAARVEALDVAGNDAFHTHATRDGVCGHRSCRIDVETGRRRIAGRRSLDLRFPEPAE